MALYRITYRPELDRDSEDVEAESVSVDGGGMVVLRAQVLVMNQPREIVVRRLVGKDVLSVDEV